MESYCSLENCSYVMKPCQIKLFNLILSRSTYPSCWKKRWLLYKKCDRNIPAIYHLKALFSCISKAFETSLGRKALNYLTSFKLLSNTECKFGKKRTNDDLAFLTDFWSSCLNHYGESVIGTLDIFKALARVL